MCPLEDYGQNAAPPMRERTSKVWPRTTGFSDWLSGSADQHLVAQLTSCSFDRYNIFTVKLVNGQVWRQESGDTVCAHWKKPADQYTATLTCGAQGSVNLQIKGEPHQFKVSRSQ
jgi:hypothetical protein